MMSVCAIYGEDAPSLAGNDAADTILVALQPVTHAFQVPALCKARKGRGTHYVFLRQRGQEPGHPPAALSGESPPFRKRSVGHPPVTFI